jgi:hypothetical protein
MNQNDTPDHPDMGPAIDRLKHCAAINRLKRYADLLVIMEQMRLANTPEMNKTMNLAILDQVCDQLDIPRFHSKGTDPKEPI